MNINIEATGREPGRFTEEDQAGYGDSLTVSEEPGNRIISMATILEKIHDLANQVSLFEEAQS